MARFLILSTLFLLGTMPGLAPGGAAAQPIYNEPPPAAINTCIDRTENTPCSFTSPLGDTISGRCIRLRGTLAYAENLHLAGHSDWRLPNVKELQSIVDYSRAPEAYPASAKRWMKSESIITSAACGTSRGDLLITVSHFPQQRERDTLHTRCVQDPLRAQNEGPRS